jgi:predicted CoA-binding protein
METEELTGIPDEVRDFVLCAGSLAVWPMDTNPLSEPYQISRYFQDQGWRLYFIHDRVERLLEENCYRDIRLIPDDYDILLLFMNPDELPEVVNAVFNADFIPRIVWTHSGIYDQDSRDRLTDEGIDVVMDKNLMEQHRKWVEA